MHREFFKDVVRDRGNMRTQTRGVHDVTRVSGRCNQHLTIKVIVIPHFHDLADQRHTVFGRVIQPADERTDDVGAGLCGEDGLRHGEHERGVGLNPLLAKVTESLEPFRRHRDFHCNVLMPACVLFTLFDHAFGIDLRHLRTHTRHVLTHLENRRLELLAFFCDQRRIGGDAVENAPTCNLGNMRCIGSV